MAKDDIEKADQAAENEAQNGRKDTVPAQVRSEDMQEKEEGPMGPIGGGPQERLDSEHLADRAGDLGLTGASRPGEGYTDDDLELETMIHEDGARSPLEPGMDNAADRELEIVGRDNIGAGGGLDEAEEARVHPLDGKTWDGDSEDPLKPLPGIAEEELRAEIDQDK